MTCMHEKFQGRNISWLHNLKMQLSVETFTFAVPCSTQAMVYSAIQIIHVNSFHKTT